MPFQFCFLRSAHVHGTAQATACWFPPSGCCSLTHGASCTHCWDSWSRCSWLAAIPHIHWAINRALLQARKADLWPVTGRSQQFMWLLRGCATRWKSQLGSMVDSSVTLSWIGTSCFHPLSSVFSRDVIDSADSHCLRPCFMRHPGYDSWHQKGPKAADPQEAGLVKNSSWCEVGCKDTGRQSHHNHHGIHPRSAGRRDVRLWNGGSFGACKFWGSDNNKRAGFP